MISKEAKAYSEDEVIEMFNKSNSLDEIKVAVNNAKDRLYTSWATVDAVDKDGQKVPIEEAIAQQKILLERGGPIRSAHQGKDVGKTLAYRILQHPVTGTTGILHLNKTYNHNLLDDQMWNEVKSGNGGSSVGGFATDRQFDSDGQSVFESLKGFNWLETTMTGSPRNEFSTAHAFSAIAKSEDKQMVKEKTVQVNKEDNEVSAETPEVSMDDRVARLEEGLSAVMSKMDDLIEATSGTPEVEKEGEEAPATEEAEVEKEADEEKKADEEEVEKEEGDDEVAKSLKSIKSDMAMVKEQLKKNTVVSVAKSSMPAEINKAEKEVHNFTDVMSGKVSMSTFVGEKQ